MNLPEQYRPKCWDEVAGQERAVKAVRRALTRGWGGRAWTIIGLSGTGKTSLAKLIAAEGAHPLAWMEQTARTLTPKGVEEIEEWYASGTLPLGGKTGRAVFLNEYHGLRQDTLETLLDAFERIPSHACWLLTTTEKGQATFFEDDTTGDRLAASSRCQEIRLESGPAVFDALARRAKAVAMDAGIDGLPDECYSACVAACKGNLRMVLQRVESGKLHDEAIGHLRGKLIATPLDGRHDNQRLELMALIAKLEGK